MSLFTKNTSLIIPSRNRHKNVFNLLGQLKSLKIEFFEILVVDSSDNKDEIILKKNSKKFNYKYFHTRPSTSFQRNFGLKKKSRLTKFLMFLDDDDSWHPDFLTNLFNHLPVKNYPISYMNSLVIKES